jgi:hypothetical protein
MLNKIEPRVETCGTSDSTEKGQIVPTIIMKEDIFDK